MNPADRVAWRTGTFAARTLAGVATTIYGFVTAAASVLPLLQKQDMQEQALIQQVRRGGLRLAISSSTQQRALCKVMLCTSVLSVACDRERCSLA